MVNPVIVLDYDPNWPGLFQSLRKRIADALGDMAVAIEHVGSTAVPDLAQSRSSTSMCFWHPKQRFPSPSSTSRA